jgi:hypothetical protein
MKLIRTVLADEAEGDCSGVGGGVRDSCGDIRGEGDSPGIAEVGVSRSCAAATVAHIAIKSAKLTLVVMSSVVEIFLEFPRSIERFLDFGGMTSGLDIVPPVHVREKVVAPFAVAQKFLIDIASDRPIV